MRSRVDAAGVAYEVVGERGEVVVRPVHCHEVVAWILLVDGVFQFSHAASE